MDLYCFGDDPCDIFALHGFGGDGEDFLPLIRASKLRWSCIDLLGHGKSPISLEAAEYDVSSQREMIYRQARGSVLLGYSMGARLALHTAVQYPQKWKALVLISGTAGIQHRKEERIQWDQKLIDRIQKSTKEDFWSYWRSLPLIATQNRASTEFLLQREKRRMKRSLAGLATSVMGFGAGVMPDLWDQLSQISMPVLLLVGEEDRKYVDLAYKMQRYIPKSFVSIIADAGHAPHFEKPTVCSQRIDEWVSSLLL